MTKPYRLDRNHEAAAATPDDYRHDTPPDPDSIVIAGLHDWMSVCKRQLPEPCPTQFADCACWWREQMQEPERRGETFLCKGGSGSDDGANWDCGYAVRLRSTLLHYLALTDAERHLVVGAREDGIFWRGEIMDFFAGLIEETMRQREMGAGPYREAATGSMTCAIKAMIGQPTAPKRETVTSRDRPPEGSAEWYAAKVGKPLEPLTPHARAPR